MTDRPPTPLTWECHSSDGYTIACFRIDVPGGVLDHRQLADIKLPADLDHTHRDGLVLSGAGPIWLYGHLVHLAHAWAFVAVHDPRLGGAVVVMRHVSAAPPLGHVVPLTGGSSWRA